MLTDREKQVLKLVGEGLSYPGVGFQLGISAGTVRNHMQGVYDHLRLRGRERNQTTAVMRALAMGEI